MTMPWMMKSIGVLLPQGMSCYRAGLTFPLACAQVYSVPQDEVTLTNLAVSSDQTTASFMLVVPAQINARSAAFGHAQVATHHPTRC